MGAARITLIVFSMASILLLAGFSTILNEKAYGGAQPPPFGDFVCWISVFPGLTVQVPLGIEDQFGPIEHEFWEQIEYCTSADKNGLPGPFTQIGIPQHYQGWDYKDPVPTGAGTGTTIILNVPQFDNQQFQTTLGELDQILVPAVKFTQSGEIPSFDTEQHWNCYDIFGPAPDIPPISLQTQHGDIDEVTVLDPFLFCAPIIKTDPFQVEFGSNEDIPGFHMVCYDIVAGDDQTILSDLPFALFDQLTDFAIGEPSLFEVNIGSQEHLLGLEKLCVPATKSFPTVGGSMIPIDSTALLLAGVQSISMWLIPVVIAGVGIGVFVIIRRK